MASAQTQAPRVFVGLGAVQCGHSQKRGYSARGKQMQMQGVQTGSTSASRAERISFATLESADIERTILPAKEPERAQARRCVPKIRQFARFNPGLGSNTVDACQPWWKQCCRRAAVLEESRQEAHAPASYRCSALNHTGF